MSSRGQEASDSPYAKLCNACSIQDVSRDSIEERHHVCLHCWSSHKKKGAVFVLFYQESKCARKNTCIIFIACPENVRFCIGGQVWGGYAARVRGQSHSPRARPKKIRLDSNNNYITSSQEFTVHRVMDYI